MKIIPVYEDELNMKGDYIAHKRTHLEEGVFLLDNQLKRFVNSVVLSYLLVIPFKDFVMTDVSKKGGGVKTRNNFHVIGRRTI